MSHSGGGFSSSASFGAQAALSAASTLMSGMSGSGHAQGTTQAAVSEGSITVRDKANSQDAGGLQKDVTQANDAISPIFNKEKEQNRLQAVQMVSDIGNQVADIVRTQSDLDGLKAAIAKTGTSLQGLPEKERLAKLAALRDTDVYKKVTENTGTGSDVQRAITAATAAVSGLAGGNLNAALAGGAAPYIANEIGKNITDQNTTAGIMAHAVVNAVLAKVQGQDALTGASGAVVGESMGILLAKQVYGKSPAALTDNEKQTIAALSTLASGLAGALAGNSTEATATAAKAGQTTVENNALKRKDATEFFKQLHECNDDNCRKKLIKKYAEISKEQEASVANCKGAECREKIKEMQDITSDYAERSEELMNAWHEGRHLTDAEFQELMYLRSTGANLQRITLMAVRNGGSARDLLDAMADAAGSDLVGGSKRGPSKATSGKENQTSSKNTHQEESPQRESNSGEGKPGKSDNSDTQKTVSMVEKQAGNNNINPATDRISTEHTVVSSGKAPKTSTPNSVYEVSRADGTKSITYYDDRGNMFSREDYGQQRTHGTLGYDSNGKVPPHEHKVEYNANGQPIGKYYRELDLNGKAIGKWISEK
ncbi:VENN motif pre-toxin domain-containing protein [Cronobacter turicensis]|uniref:VENN motif pre-toxin domain-containing protein n=1 Tax=Cronobacter turicensis TaxID=413502 RepID=UPI0024C42EA0|nr:VENN motif pre-toxin domain-containing protein [Cronobacter turicensis]MDK1237504.1 VENN motif pre-toxin domain-containing protein [Cronobacter turicensis]